MQTFQAWSNLNIINWTLVQVNSILLSFRTFLFVSFHFYFFSLHTCSQMNGNSNAFISFISLVNLLVQSNVASFTKWKINYTPTNNISINHQKSCRRRLSLSLCLSVKGMCKQCEANYIANKITKYETGWKSTRKGERKSVSQLNASMHTPLIQFLYYVTRAICNIVDKQQRRQQNLFAIRPVCVWIILHCVNETINQNWKRFCLIKQLSCVSKCVRCNVLNVAFGEKIRFLVV